MDYKPAGFRTVTPNATYRDTKAAIELYKRALGLTVDMLLEIPGGTVMHVSATIGDSQFFMSDEFEGSPRQAPDPKSPVAFYLYLPDVDASYRQAMGAGMTCVSEPEDMFWGDRTATVMDPFGYAWTLATQIKEVPPQDAIARFNQMMAKAS
ncbi:VOC family protein [Acaryochloris sp. IP29b_bin.137]|uniref:VOC family protein n=1 Tax=Acaryochloris sp. IP29b_bin.137 TaxID=2969217 RepID=UPI0026175972|nr:VOC family protein [Acaryochloris sp. IP29b_bin.137]